MTNNTKNRNAAINESMAIVPYALWSFLNSRTDNNNGTKRNTINPMTEPIPCIFEAVVLTSLVSLTLKKQVNIHAPIANMIIKAIVIPASNSELHL